LRSFLKRLQRHRRQSSAGPAFGALFHDVGKTARAGDFAENQRDAVNPHDAGDPAESARIIKQHVTDGENLPQHNLPRAVVDVIRQHHGTSLVRYFHQLAVDQSRAPFTATPRPASSKSPRHLRSCLTRRSQSSLRPSFSPK